MSQIATLLAVATVFAWLMVCNCSRDLQRSVLAYKISISTMISSDG